jgi:ribose transport system permease protein
MNTGRRSYVRPLEVGVPYALVILALAVGAIAIPGFLSSGHLDSMSQTAAYIGIVAIGQTLVLLLGGLDLSIPYGITLAAVLVTGLPSSNLSGADAFVIALLVGLGVGVVNGLGVAVLDIHPMVMTLGMNSILEGVALVYTNGSPVGIAPNFVTTLSTGVKGVPYVAMLWFGLTVVVTLVLVFTKFGRGIYSVGSNRRASELCGMPVKRTIVVAYAVSGLSAALVGVLLAGYAGQAYFGMGDTYLLPSVAVVVIGGTSILGGKGSYVQTVAGALFITILESALLTIGVAQAGQDILYGAIILFMAFFNQVAVSRESSSSPLPARLKAFRGWIQPVPSPKEETA